MTSFLGASINIVLNIVLIPIIGINGASLATLASYLIVFVLRIVDINRFLKIEVNYFKITSNTVLLGTMALSIIMLDKWMVIP